MEHYHILNRPNRELKNKSDIERILKAGKFATIALCCENEPYIVTLSYGYDNESKRLFFHCAKEGLKLDFLSKNHFVCATVIKDNGYLEGECGHCYESVVFWGDLQIVDKPQEQKYGMSILLNHLEHKTSVIREKLAKSENYYGKMVILKLTIKEIHAKAGQ